MMGGDAETRSPGQRAKKFGKMSPETSKNERIALESTGEVFRDAPRTKSVDPRTKAVDPLSPLCFEHYGAIFFL